MLNFNQFKSQNIGIYGLGITGSSIAETLKFNGANAIPNNYVFEYHIIDSKYQEFDLNTIEFMKKTIADNSYIDFI